MKDYDRIKQEGGPFDTLIKEAADTHGVSYDLLHKQLFLESSFNPQAVSPTGPRGIGQFTKATGKAYGLVTDEDFFDPAKSIDAAARHMKDNLKIAGGDELKALLAYNQGAGKLGRPQLEAYDRGDFGAISEEGRNYMAKLADVAKVGKTTELTDFVKPTSGFEAPAELGKQASVEAGAIPFSGASMYMGGKDVPEKAPGFKELLHETTGRTDDDLTTGLFKGTGTATENSIETSPLGVAVRAALENDEFDFSESFTMVRDVFNDPFQGGQLTDWSEDDYDALKASGLDPQFYDVVLRGRRENFESNLKLAQENERLIKEAQGTGLGAQVVGGAASMIGDPWTAVNPARGAGVSIGSRLVGGALVGGALGGLSEETSSKASGREADYTTAIAGGAAFAGVLNGLLGARPGSLAPEATTSRGYAEDWEGDAGLRAEVGEDMLERILARHGEGGLGNRDVELPDGMEPTQRPRVDMDEMDVDAILGRHGEGGVEPMGRETDIADILARYGESADPHSYSGSFMRLEAREKARLSGLEEDPTAMPYREGDEIKEDAAVPYMDVPFDKDAVRLTDGTIVSGGSPLNPKTLKDFAEIDPASPVRANKGVRFGSISEIGLVLGRTENEELRGIARDLFRSPTGYQDGSNGKYGATASDIEERLRSQDNVAHNHFKELFDAALKEPFWHNQRMSSDAKLEMMSRRVVEALEASSHGGKVRVTVSEQRLVDALKEHMGQKWDYIENPGQFGNMNARSLLEETRHAGSYFPMRYSTAAKQAMIQRLGGPDGLQEAIVRSWLASYAKRPATKARVDKMIEEKLKEQGIEKATPEQIREAVEEYAKRKAYGISHTDQFNRSSIVEEHLRDGEGVENNDYLEARNLFDSDVRINLPDGQLFNVDDLREFNILRLVPQYDRRVNGDIALMGATGKSTAELKTMAIKLRQKEAPGEPKAEADALMDALKLFTGRSRQERLEGGLETFLRSLMDVGFVTKNAMMGIQNFTEAASLVVKGHIKMLTHGIPFLKNLTTAGTKLGADDIKALHQTVFGKELDDLIRPSRQDIVDRLRESRRMGSGRVASQVLGTLKFATGEAAARSPFTWLLRETGNYIMDAGRQGIMVDLANKVLNGVEPKHLGGDLFSPERLRSASISPEQFKGIEDLIRSHFKMTKKGKWSLVDPAALASDSRAMDLWRLGDSIADETILRPHKMSTQSVQQHGALVSAALQFKMFVIRSINARGVRAWHEATRNGQVLDQTLKVLVSVGMATGFYAAQAHLKSLAMPVRERKEYLDKALNGSMLAHAALFRSSHLGAIPSAAGFIAAPLGYDPAAMVRTSILPRDPKPNPMDDRPIRYGVMQSPKVQDFLSRSLEQVPAAQVARISHEAGRRGR